VHLFLDTGSYLGFYGLSKDNLEELRKLVVAVKSGQTVLYLPEQVRDEFARRREGVIAIALKALEEAKLPRVVDEIIEDRVRLVAAGWPSVDRDGRLLFPDLGRSLPRAQDVDRLRKAVDGHRAKHRQVSRDFRVGDSFLVRGFATQPRKWSYVLDVTRASRQAARFAQLRALTPIPESRRPGRGGHPHHR
jgi:hypothetical protein